MKLDYVGSELDLFAGARRWKAYWSRLVRPYLGRRILDVGAGIGATAREFAGHACDSYLALEPDEALVLRMREAATKGEFALNFQAMAGMVGDLPPEQAFDTILYIDVLEHIDADRDELRRAASHLLPGGRLLVLSPAHQWLFTPFDRAIGHFRRYDKSSLAAARPENLILERVFYLDSVGLLASLGNRLLLRSANPTASQIGIWDGWMVPASTLIDRLSGFHLGKSIVAIFKRPD